MVQIQSFVLVPGRTSKQGTTLNEGKSTLDYVQETSTLVMCAQDMELLGLGAGRRVRVTSSQGSVDLPCQPGREGELYADITPPNYSTTSKAVILCSTRAQAGDQPRRQRCTNRSRKRIVQIESAGAPIGADGDFGE